MMVAGADLFGGGERVECALSVNHSIPPHTHTLEAALTIDSCSRWGFLSGCLRRRWEDLVWRSIGSVRWSSGCWETSSKTWASSSGKRPPSGAWCAGAWSGCKSPGRKEEEETW